MSTTSRLPSLCGANRGLKINPNLCSRHQKTRVKNTLFGWTDPLNICCITEESHRWCFFTASWWPLQISFPPVWLCSCFSEASGPSKALTSHRHRRGSKRQKNRACSINATETLYSPQQLSLYIDSSACNTSYPPAGGALFPIHAAAGRHFSDVSWVFALFAHWISCRMDLELVSFLTELGRRAFTHKFVWAFVPNGLKNEPKRFNLNVEKT